MPELPEVETVVQELRTRIVDKTIQDLVELRAGTIHWHQLKAMNALEKLVSVNRRGKYIILLTNSHQIIIHLRMTGKLILLAPKQKLPSHTRAYFVFADQSKLAFDDVRTFGTVDIYPCDACAEQLAKQGIEPLSNKFTNTKLQELVSNRKAPIKNTLLNQNLIAGIGNIYAIEALYRAHIDPRSPASKLTKDQCSSLVKSIKQVLRAAIRHNGTSVSDYRRVDDQTGEFQNFLQVYQKDKCPRGHKIQKIKQAGRSTFYCPECQK